MDRSGVAIPGESARHRLRRTRCAHRTRRRAATWVASSRADAQVGVVRLARATCVPRVGRRPGWPPAVPPWAWPVRGGPSPPPAGGG